MAKSDEIDLMGLDENFQPVTYLKFVNLQWKRRYYQPGSFVVQLIAADYDPRIKYVYTHQRPELGVVERMETQREIKGDFVLLSGRFFEHVLGWRVAFPHFSGSYTLQSLAERFIRHEWYKIRKYDIQIGSIPSKSVEVKWENDPLGDCMYETLKTLEMSNSIYFDPNTLSLTYSVWQGKDRTQSQSTNAFATFSDESCYVTSFKYVEDMSNYKNVAMILHGENDDRWDQYLDEWGKYGGRWIVIRGNDEDSKETQKQQAVEELQKYPIVKEAEIDVIQNGFFYLQDYDLGDKCDIVNHQYGVSFEGRIAVVDEVWKQGKHTVSLGFGEQAKTQYQRLKNFAVGDRKAH